MRRISAHARRHVFGTGIAVVAVVLVLVTASAAAARSTMGLCTAGSPCRMSGLGGQIEAFVDSVLQSAGIVESDSGMTVGTGTTTAATTPAEPEESPAVAARTGPFVVSAVTGNDANSCTAGSPCKTIGHAVAVADAGDRIVVEPGVYPEQVTVAKRLVLDGHGATVDATGKVNGIVVSGAGAAGSVVQGFTVQDAIGEGILVVSTSHVGILSNTLKGNDKGANTTVTQECAPMGAIPGDCGEALHLMSVASSRVMSNDVHGNVGGILVTDEVGPSHGNLIASNSIRNNATDCGITLPSHNPLGTTDPSKAGVYDNTVSGNLSQGNGGAGVGMFAPFPGAASYDNRVVDNRLLDNGEAGVAIHAHTPGQNVSGNVIAGNTIAGNGIDPDAGSGAPVGIAVLTVDPSSGTITGNTIDREHFGVFIAGPFTANGLQGNSFGSSVAVPVGHA
jgi:nitrous oxidase accessory protein NosD